MQVVGRGPFSLWVTCTCNMVVTNKGKSSSLSGAGAAGWGHHIAAAPSTAGDYAPDQRDHDTHVFLEAIQATTEGALMIRWVRFHRPTSLEAEVTLVEDHLAVGQREWRKPAARAGVTCEEEAPWLAHFMV